MSLIGFDYFSEVLENPDIQDGGSKPEGGLHLAIMT